MAINEDIMNIGKEQNFSPDPQIGQDFFTSTFSISDEEPKKAEERKDEVFFSDWKTGINRMLMQGWTKEKIFDAVGEKIENSNISEEILAYLNKYEGLIGTVFVDSGVLEQGFPVSMIPKGWDKFHRFAINCHHPIVKVSTSVEGGLSGDISAFLSSMDKTIKKENKVCSITGLPVLQKGGCSKEFISEFLSSIGRTGDTLKALQEALLEIALGKTKEEKKVQEFEKPDLNYGLHTQQVEVAPTEERKVSPSPQKYNLKQSKVQADISIVPEVEVVQYAPSQKEDVVIVVEQNPIADDSISLSFKPSSKTDITFEENEKEIIKSVKMDRDLRF